MRPLGRLSTCMSKEMEENLCINLGRIRRRRILIRGGRDSNFLSTKIALIEIIKTGVLRMKRRLLGKNGNTTNKMLGM